MPDPAIVLPPRANQLILAGTLADEPEFRFTPSGRLLACLTVEHLSQQEGGTAQRIEVRMGVLALGALAEWCRSLHPGQLLQVEGRLNQKRWIRDDKIRWGQVELWAERIVLLPEAP